MSDVPVTIFMDRAISDAFNAFLGNDRERELFEAFLAGFDASGEGFNGDYVNRCYRQRDATGRVTGRNERFMMRIRHDFLAWRNPDLIP